MDPRQKPTAEASDSHAGDPFATTHWSVVLKAADTASPEADRALGELYEAYSFPMYAFVRRRGYSHHDAQDLLHDFFRVLIEKKYLRAVSRERGRFRSFLLGVLKHFLANEWHRVKRQKRGGEFEMISLDAAMTWAEQRFQGIEAEGVPIETLYDREWARTLLARVLAALREAFEASGRVDQFEALKGFLAVLGDASAYVEAAAKLGTTEQAVKVAVHRLRRRFHEALRRELGQTVGLAGEVEEELRYLMEVVRGQD